MSCGCHNTDPCPSTTTTSTTIRPYLNEEPCDEIVLTRCVEYSGPNLPCIGIVTGDNLDVILDKLNLVFCDLLPPTTTTNSNTTSTTTINSGTCEGLSITNINNPEIATLLGSQGFVVSNLYYNENDSTVLFPAWNAQTGLDFQTTLTATPNTTATDLSVYGLFDLAALGFANWYSLGYYPIITITSAAGVEHPVSVDPVVDSSNYEFRAVIESSYFNTEVCPEGAGVKIKIEWVPNPMGD